MTNNNNAFHIAFGVDDNYCRGMGVMITSLLRHNPDMNFVFHACGFGMSADNQQRLAQLAALYNTEIQVHTLAVTDLAPYADLPCYGSYPLGPIIRLLIPRYLQNTTNKVLYLDADMLCFGSVRELRDIDLNHVIAAVIADDEEMTSKPQIAALQLPHPEYFNSGVMLINIGEWLANDVEHLTMKTLFSRRSRFMDQDVLNIALNGKTHYIDEKWNHRIHLVAGLSHGHRTLNPIDDVRLVHFTGPTKPWHNWCLHDAKDLFLSHQTASPWKDMPLDPPRKTRELKLFSKFLVKQGHYLTGTYWHMHYLYRKSLRKP